MKKIFTLSLIAIFAAMQLCSAQSGISSLVMMRNYLYVLGTGGDSTMLDGDLTQYDPSFSNALDGMDARKMDNFSENIGMIRGTTVLVIERRHTIELTDTIFYKIWNLQASRQYQLQFVASNLTQPGLSAYLEDLYLGTRTPVALESTTFSNFKISADPASYNPYRFRIIFSTPLTSPDPITPMYVTAYQQQKDIKIDWQTAKEANMKGYTVEKSTDGKIFTNLGELRADNLPANDYSYTDANPAKGFNYYRILSTAATGESVYSSVMKVLLNDGISTIKVFPNPVAGNTLNLQMHDQPSGVYNVRLMNAMGQPVLAKSVHHSGGTATEGINLPAGMARGIYQLEIAGPGASKTNISIIY